TMLKSSQAKAQCHLVFGLSKAELAAPSPNLSRVGAVFAALGKSTFRGEIQDTKELLFVLLLGGSRDQLMPSCIDQSENLRKTELAWIHSTPARGQANDRAHKVVGRNGHQQMLLHHLGTVSPNVVKLHGSFQRPQ